MADREICIQVAVRLLPVWRGLNRVINEYLDGITLQDLLDQQRAHYANDYMI